MWSLRDEYGDEKLLGAQLLDEVGAAARHGVGAAE